MKKILIVEDDQIVANIYRNKFALEGYAVEVALDGETGLELVKSYRPDAMVLDLMLPRMTGVDLMKKVRADPELQKMPVIVFSNTYLTNMVQEAWKAGATKCLSKANCSPKQMIEVLRAALGNGSAAAAKAAPEGEAPGSRAHAAQPRGAEADAAAAGDADAEFQANLRKVFIQGLPGALSGLRASLQGLIKAGSQAVRLTQLQDLYRRVHALTGNAGLAGLVLIAQMADALEALLKELHEKPKCINASTLRTVASAVDFLGVLQAHGLAPHKQEMPSARILVVDDEPISRRAITHALEKAKLKSENVDEPTAAYKLLSENPYDLIFLDVDMPGMNGFELCSKLRQLPSHKRTPVVFVTSLNDFESRANSTMSGGNDFIAKPFLFIELAVKALVYVLRGRVQPTR